MGCLKRGTILITAGFLGVGGYILYQNLKTRVDELEKEIWGIEDFENNDCKCYDKAYGMKNKNYSNFNKEIDEIVLETVEFNNTNNELHDEVQNHLKDLEEEQNKDENK